MAMAGCRLLCGVGASPGLCRRLARGRLRLGARLRMRSFMIIGRGLSRGVLGRGGLRGVVLVVVDGVEGAMMLRRGSSWRLCCS